ncbi:DNA-directed RNA polymerase III subunit RPC2 [Tribonema minus]|uniref:DNA-directed RNA polymerase subunit beta n=1 Tax=Tribonema minus TaxID=303371 RepID=A0A835Z565_9STRA|nr:DNA-directed RNA polymerase III subunit RPC2 [Tribonema minus]
MILGVKSRGDASKRRHDAGAEECSEAPPKSVKFAEGEESPPSMRNGHEQVKGVKDKWKLLPHFLQMRGLMRQHIDSFNYFCTTEIKKIVAAKSNCVVLSDSKADWFLEYTDVYIEEPSMFNEMGNVRDITPYECRLRDCTYQSPIKVNVRYTKGNNIIRKNGIVIGYLPIMLRSAMCHLTGKSEDQLAQMKECPYDPGGYFIVKGVEKVILMQEQLSKNRVIIELDNKGNVSANIQSSTHERKSRCAIHVKHGKVYLHHNTLGDDVPIVVFMKAMGVESDQEIVQLVGSEPHLVDAFGESIEEALAVGVMTQKQALKYIGRKMRNPKASLNRKQYKARNIPAEDEAREMLSSVVLSHIPCPNYNFRAKCVYTAHIVRRVLTTVLDPSSLDDKDYYGNKRLESAGQLISLLFEDLFKRFNGDLKRYADTCLAKQNHATPWDISGMLAGSMNITQGFIHAISTGNWVVKRFKMDRQGVTQVLSRLSYISCLGMMTRVDSQFQKERKVSGPRALQPSQWGMLCPADTPEGESCGLVKNLALLAHVTSDEEPEPLVRLCMDMGVEDVTALSGAEINAPDTYLVFMNGAIIGAHARPELFVRRLRFLRRQGMVGEFVSVYLHDVQRAVYIASDGGRVCRPLLVVENGQTLLTERHMAQLASGVRGLKDLLRIGVVEYVDVNEENNCLIALSDADLTERHTHLEVDPLTLLGVVAGLIPYPHHNQSPRNTYQCAMGKQAIGTIALNQYERIDGLLYTLVYPQKPMCKTRVIDLIHFDEVPAGQNSIIAVMSYSGYDIEDASVLNKGSIDRGFGRCMVFRKHQVALKTHPSGTSDSINGPPDPNNADLYPKGENDRGWKKYKALDKDGIAYVGAKLEKDTVIINKMTPVGTDISADRAAATKMREASLSYKTSSPSYVDKVMIASNEVENQFFKVLVRQVRRPEVGDKFSSRHGQKGVCGIIVPQADMPFSEMGICPDLIMNPHGFPSRMTVGKMIELIAGKAGVLHGHQAYGTAFGEEFGNADKVTDICQALVDRGFSYCGKDILMSGINGEPVLNYIFAGPVFYQKLKHMVMDKMHARARGPRATLTRQPTEGRSRDGGLRLGEMERDCLIGYGASALIMERLMISSDAFTAYVCEGCGLLGYQGWCQGCRRPDSMSSISVPYACKLLFQELQSMNIVPRLRLQEY